MDSYAMQRELLILGHKCLRKVSQPLSWDGVVKKFKDSEPISVEINEVKCPR